MSVRDCSSLVTWVSVGEGRSLVTRISVGDKIADCE